MVDSAIKRIPVIKVNDDKSIDASDALAIEEPLEIRLEYGAENKRKLQNI